MDASHKRNLPAVTDRRVPDETLERDTKARLGEDPRNKERSSEESAAIREMIKRELSRRREVG